MPALRADYVEEALSDEIGEITDLERAVIASLKGHEFISSHPDDSEALARRTFGERVADQIAIFGGSWKFIISFGVFIVLWIVANIVLWAAKPPDPYPFILLNLILSCLAALQAPVIMMSQKRVEERDRQRAELDYQINLKAELEIRHLHEKLDHLLYHHGERLLEIQEIQTGMLRQLVEGSAPVQPVPMSPVGASDGDAPNRGSRYRPETNVTSPPVGISSPPPSVRGKRCIGGALPA